MMDDITCKIVVNEFGVGAEGWRAKFNRDAREEVVNRMQFLLLRNARLWISFSLYVFFLI